MNQELRGSIEVFIGAAVWGCIGLFVKAMDQAGSSVAMTAVLRMAFSTVIMAILSLLYSGPASFRIPKRALFFTVLMGMFCNGLCNITYNLAIIQTGVSLGAVMLNTSPIFAAIMAGLFFKEKFTSRKIFALLLNVAGCVLAVTGGQIGSLQVPFLGIVNGILSGFMYGLVPILAKCIGGGNSVFVISTYSSAVATVVLLLWQNPFAIGEGAALSSWLLVLGFFYALLPTCLSYALYFLGTQRIRETSKIPVIASVETLSAVLLGMAVYGEVISLAQWIGIVIIFGSIALMNQRKMIDNR